MTFVKWRVGKQLKDLWGLDRIHFVLSMLQFCMLKLFMKPQTQLSYIQQTQARFIGTREHAFCTIDELSRGMITDEYINMFVS